MSRTQLFRITLKKGAKFSRDLLQRTWAWMLHKSGRIDFPVPPNSLMRITASKTITGYFESGLSCYLPIATSALREGLDLDSGIRILDFGCGVGRQLVHFTKHFPINRYSACDIDSSCVSFVQASYPMIDTRCNSFHPPLPFESETFEMIYGVSVFSHLPPADHASWLNELARVLKPGGYCFLTVEGEVALEHMTPVLGGDLSQLASRLESEGVLYAEYRDLSEEKKHATVVSFGRKYAGVSGSYGSTVITRRHIEDNWNLNPLEVVAVLDGIIDRRQDLVILKRPRLLT